MRTLVEAAVALVAMLAFTGCGDQATPEESDVTPDLADCPAYAATTEGQADVYADFIVGLEADGPLVDDLDARVEAFSSVGERLCVELTEARPLAVGAVLVSVDRSLDADGQARLISALTKVDGVTYAEPDRVVTPDGGVLE